MSCFFTCFTYFDLRHTGSFSVTDPFLTTFYCVEKRNRVLCKNRGEGFEKSYVPLGGIHKLRHTLREAEGVDEV